jgi:predicted ester cyclase
MGNTFTADQWRDFDKQLFPAFADFSSTVLDQVAEGNKVATRFVMGGTQTGEYLGIPPSGVRAEFSVTAFDLVENGKIIEHWSDVDFTGFLQKLQKKN